jgi:hypothetical protein
MDLFPTAYFGSIHYFRELYHASNPLIEAHETFPKQTGRSRCSILSANGIQRLSIPVIRKNGSKTITHEVTISGSEKWQKDHWKSIESAYASSPFFEAYDREVKALIYNEDPMLLSFNKTIIEQIFALLDLDHKLNETSEFELKPTGSDFRSFDFESQISCKHYFQVFNERTDFISNLSILDLLFCEGPLARNWIISSH